MARSAPLPAALLALSASLLTPDTVLAQDLHVVTPRHYTVQARGWNSAVRQPAGNSGQDHTDRWTARNDEFVHGALTCPDDSFWLSVAREVGSGGQDGYLLRVAADGTEQRFGPLWSADVPSNRFTGSMVRHADGRLLAATPSRLQGGARNYRIELPEILSLDPRSGGVTTLVSASDLAPFIAGFYDSDVFGLHWRHTTAGKVELVFGLNLMGTDSRMDLLGWRPGRGLRFVRRLAELPAGIVNFEHSPPALAASGDSLYFVTPIVTPYSHTRQPEPARLQRLDLASGATETLARIPYDPNSTLRGFQGLRAMPDGTLYYGQRHDVGIREPVRYELFRLAPGSTRHERLETTFALPGHAGVPAISRFVLATRTRSPWGAADLDHDFRRTPADVDWFVMLFRDRYPLADLDGDGRFETDDIVVFVRSFLAAR